jgi:hypothetical protein
VWLNGIAAIDIGTHCCRHIPRRPIFLSVAPGARSASLLAHQESLVYYYILLDFRSNVLPEG